MALYGGAFGALAGSVRRANTCDHRLPDNYGCMEPGYRRGGAFGASLLGKLTPPVLPKCPYFLTCFRSGLWGRHWIHYRRDLNLMPPLCEDGR